MSKIKRLNAESIKIMGRDEGEPYFIIHQEGVAKKFLLSNFKISHKVMRTLGYPSYVHGYDTSDHSTSPLLIEISKDGCYINVYQEVEKKGGEIKDYVKCNFQWIPIEMVKRGENLCKSFVYDDERYYPDEFIRTHATRWSKDKFPDKIHAYYRKDTGDTLYIEFNVLNNKVNVYKYEVIEKL